MPAQFIQGLGALRFCIHKPLRLVTSVSLFFSTDLAGSLFFVGHSIGIAFADVVIHLGNSSAANITRFGSRAIAKDSGLTAPPLSGLSL